jgi:hypothetical protein
VSERAHAPSAAVAPAAPGPRPWRRAAPWLAGAAGAAVLLATFAAYRSPHLALDIANRVWSCFQ